MRGKALRVLYLAGSGDASQSLRAYQESHYNPFIGHAGYSDQMFRACDDLGVELLALCSNPKAEEFGFRTLRIERRANPLEGKSGLSYHGAEVGMAAQLSLEARRFRADVVILPFEPMAFLLEPLRLSGVKLVQALHCVLWSEFRPRPRSWKILAPLLGRSYRRGISAVLSASHYITQQVEAVAGGGPVCPIVEFLPTFRAEAFSSVAPPQHDRRPFRVMFVGRFEEYKGVFILLDVARRLKQMGRTDVVFDMCGDGPAFSDLKASVDREGLSAIFVLHGWCAAEKLRMVSMQSHAYVVPTTTQFIEGFNHVVIESLLVGRPVITSKVCPAVDYVPECVHLVPPDAVDGYLNGIVELADNRALYTKLQSRCLDAAHRFLSPAEGYGAAVRHVLSALQAGRKPERLTIDLTPGASVPSVA